MRRRPRAPRSLGGKLIWMLSLVGGGGAIAIAVLLAAIITPGFDRLERRSVALRQERLRASIASITHDTAIAARDIAEGRSTAGIDGVARIAPGRRPDVRWTGGGSPESLARFAATVGGTAALRGRRATGFYAPLDKRIAAIGIAPDPRRDGFVLAVRMVSPDLLARAGEGVAIRSPQATTARAKVPLTGVDGRPVAQAVLPAGGELTRLGRWMLWAAVGGTLLLLAALLLMLRWSIDRLVLRPLARIERHMQGVRATGTVAMLDAHDRKDEIGSLVAGLNAMLRRLQDMAGRLELQSFRLGRSESGAAVLHNVRNALSPVSAILSQGLTQPPVAERETIERAVAELARDDVPPERRARLVGFVMAAIDAAARGRVERLAQFETGRTALANVLDILGQQRDVADSDLALERCDVTDLIARNGVVTRLDGEGPSIAVSFPAQPCWVRANRVILAQVIGNLFRNAAEAIAARGGDSGQIIVTIARGGTTAAITIADDGDGFDPAAAPILFQRGYSTRRAKSGGLGLHWCANWVAAMGGTLRLDSNGPGFGARAILTLPVAD